VKQLISAVTLLGNKGKQSITPLKFLMKVTSDVTSVI
jgi:hypothetical protein